MRIRYRGDEIEFIEGFWMERNESCEVCGEQQKALALSMPSSSTLQSVVNELKAKLDCCNESSHEMVFVSLWAGSKLLYAEVHFDCSLESLS